MNKIQTYDNCICGNGEKYKFCCKKAVDRMRMDINDLIVQRGFFSARQMVWHMKIRMNNPEYQNMMDKQSAEYTQKIETERKNNSRPKPSQNLILGESRIEANVRAMLVDYIAEIVDENPAGRSEMCVLFAVLAKDALIRMGYKAESFWGKVKYHSTVIADKYFEWDHAWVSMENELIDGNIDSIVENPIVPKKLGITTKSFWGLKEEIPDDREFGDGYLIDDEFEKHHIDEVEIREFRKNLFSWMDGNQKQLIGT